MEKAEIIKFSQIVRDERLGHLLDVVHVLAEGPGLPRAVLVALHSEGELVRVAVDTGSRTDRLTPNRKCAPCDSLLEGINDSDGRAGSMALHGQLELVLKASTEKSTSGKRPQDASTHTLSSRGSEVQRPLGCVMVRAGVPVRVHTCHHGVLRNQKFAEEGGKGGRKEENAERKT